MWLSLQTFGFAKSPSGTYLFTVWGKTIEMLSIAQEVNNQHTGLWGHCLHVSLPHLAIFLLISHFLLRMIKIRRKIKFQSVNYIYLSATEMKGCRLGGQGFRDNWRDYLWISITLVLLLLAWIIESPGKLESL